MKAYYLFGKTPLSVGVDKETKQILIELEDVTDREQYLRLAYDRVTRAFDAERGKTFTRIGELFSSGLSDLMNRTGFMHCTNQNFVLANLLVKSGLFTESAIRLKWTAIWYCSPHQYLEIKADGKIFAVDCWARHYGIPFGSYAKGFNTTVAKSFAE
jgi:hypothetical protein